MPAPFRPSSLAPWLGLAAAVHVLIWVAWRAPSPGPRLVTSPPPSDVLEVEIWPAAHVPAPAAVAAPPPVAIATASARALAPSGARAVEGEPSSVADVTGHAATPMALPAAGPMENGLSVKDEQSASRPDAPSAPLGVSPSSAVSAPSAVSPSSALAVAPAERLAALGYGAPHAAALQPLLNVAPIAIAEDRLNLHLAQAIVDDDRDHSLGIEGPVTNALHTGAMGVVWPKSLSKVVITIGRDGKLADFRILETNRDARALKALGERVKRLLAEQTVRVPSGRAMEFVYEVKSEVLLPSGRAPGLSVEVFGLPLKEGSDEKSSKISILTPRLEFESQSQPDPERNGKITQTPPQLVYGLSLLGIDADPVDLAANARQVVRTRLIQQRVL